jgi:hypothetical protein
VCSLFVHLLFAFRPLYGRKCPLSSLSAWTIGAHLRNSSLFARPVRA